MKYSTPEIEVMSLEMVDVIATSNGGNAGIPTPGENQTPIEPFNVDESLFG